MPALEVPKMGGQRSSPSGRSRRVGWWLLAAPFFVAGILVGALAATSFTRGQSEDPSLLDEVIALVVHGGAAIGLIVFAAILVRTTRDEASSDGA